MRSVLFAFLLSLTMSPQRLAAEEPIGLLFDASASTNLVVTDVRDTLDALHGFIPPSVRFNVVVWQSQVVAEVTWQGSGRFSELTISPPGSGTKLEPALTRWYDAALERTACPRAIIIVHGLAVDVSDVAWFIRDEVTADTFLYFLVVPTDPDEKPRTSSYRQLLADHNAHINFADFSAPAFQSAVHAARAHECHHFGY